MRYIVEKDLASGLEGVNRPFSKNNFMKLSERGASTKNVEVLGIRVTNQSTAKFNE
jgi:hypothetical protein